LLRESKTIATYLRTKVIGLEVDGRKIQRLKISTPTGEATAEANSIVLAAGGIGTAKILLEYQKYHSDAFGGQNGALGYYYMGHAFGKIADIVLHDPDAVDAADFFKDKTGTWVRRRIDIVPEAQIADGIMNIAFWVDNAAFHEPRHGSGILSAVYLALCVPPVGRLLVAEGIRRMHIGSGGNYLKHITNIVMHPLATAVSAWRILKLRYLTRPPCPGFLIHNRSGRYALAYHSEQRAQRESRVFLNKDGKLEIDLRFSQEDAISILKAHERVDAALRASGLGYLDYHMPAEKRVTAILSQAQDGFHQEGLLRMGNDPATSVVDRNGKVHDFDNLYVASTGIFPTSGQANPTFTACALGVRLAHHLASGPDRVVR
jgi:hypothetical protein